MADRKLSQTIRNASAVNLKFSADLLNLGRDYVRAFSAALTNPDSAPKPEPVRAPLLLAGRSGDTANAAFAISNSGKISGTVTLQVTGDFGDTQIRVDPERVSFDDDTSDRVVRIIAVIGSKTEVGRDYAGTVLIPELDHRITHIVLRKLPG
jgi:hypothetical protein